MLRSAGPRPGNKKYLGSGDRSGTVLIKMAAKENRFHTLIKCHK